MSQISKVNGKHGSYTDTIEKILVVTVLPTDHANVPIKSPIFYVNDNPTAESFKTELSIEIETVPESQTFFNST